MMNTEPLKAMVDEAINKNRDNTVKAVGDTILVWDTSRLTDKETTDIVHDVLDTTLITLHPSIVVEVNQKYDGTLYIGDRAFPKTLDLVIWNKTLNKLFRTSSDFVKIYKHPENKMKKSTYI